jgi:hypothetical protein
MAKSYHVKVKVRLTRAILLGKREVYLSTLTAMKPMMMMRFLQESRSTEVTNQSSSAPAKGINSLSFNGCLI